MENKAWYKSPEMIVGLSALTVSLVAVFVGIYSAYIDRAYARASVWPRLEIFRSYSGKAETFEYGVTNSGTGPAKIKYVVIKYNDKAIQYWRDIDALSAKDVNFTQSFISNRIISPLQVVNPIKATTASSMIDFINTESQYVSIDICYCSIYDECWLIDRKNAPANIEECVISEKERFLQ
ncbi:hypothetical protein HII17_06930 [Thalassotalea sp. M1531]|uniref:Uncharacterized protein n=1 Tax=Thalassotalea algicola TaxID=2716224 RepID=A0A7Y0LB44_9GAMM|nr:hypothetical protein [Thalassotalea algicola]NMP31290.1 hypothetical protein [Thalassotalea algicola]